MVSVMTINVCHILYKVVDQIDHLNIGEVVVLKKFYVNNSFKGHGRNFSSIEILLKYDLNLV